LPSEGNRKRRTGQNGGCRSSWEHFPHGADVGLVGFGPTRAEAYRQAATALAVVVTDPARVRTVTSVRIECRARSDELLLVEWLNTLIYEMAVRSMLSTPSA
jgi:tRNA nucleotidyltransferase (CCA-adding enzyme)